MYPSYDKKYNIDANLDASDNIISDNEPSSEMLYKPESKTRVSHKWGGGSVMVGCVFTSHRQRGH